MAGAGDHFFEGTEKLLEVWFASSTDKDCDLRVVARKEWESLLKLVKCEIISCASSVDMDAYVLSESSMFVTKERFILKTCGRTTLLLAVKPLIKIVKEHCGFDKVMDIFYSRKNFSRPELQHGVHRNFEDEVTHLDQLFPNGAAYTLGRINRDCWYLYTLDEEGVTMPDQTFELLMWDMCQEKMKIFTKEVCQDGPDASKKSGITDIIPGAKIDDFLFEPCGYSMNGLLDGGFYITIHVTPEPHCSYVSFESNVPQRLRIHGYLDDFLSLNVCRDKSEKNAKYLPEFFEHLGFLVHPEKSDLIPNQKCQYIVEVFDTVAGKVLPPLDRYNKVRDKETYHDLIEKVLNVFNPGKFLMTIFANKASLARNSHRAMESTKNMKGYVVQDHQYCRFKNYNLTYTFFSRPVI